MPQTATAPFLCTVTPVLLWLLDSSFGGPYSSCTFFQFAGDCISSSSPGFGILNFSLIRPSISLKSETARCPSYLARLLTVPAVISTSKTTSRVFLDYTLHPRVFSNLVVLCVHRLPLKNTCALVFASGF
uniref:Uncharacterized protein K02A2.6 n=1 Tax=Schistocephalus solidus TaxID=70667 RepID=A0A0X3QFI8_SCHSO